MPGTPLGPAGLSLGMGGGGAADVALLPLLRIRVHGAVISQTLEPHNHFHPAGEDQPGAVPCEHVPSALRDERAPSPPWGCCSSGPFTAGPQ